MEDGLPGTAPALDRRRVLTLALLAGALTACGPGAAPRPKGPDPLVALAAAARADAGLAAAAIAANPALRARVDPLRAARTAHAAALDAEVARAAGPTATPQPAPVAATTQAAPPATLAAVRAAVAASQRGAADLVPDLPAERVGLVASVAACCAAYVAVLA